MTRRSRLVAPLAAGAVVAGTMMLGGLWVADRTHRWERPRWPSESFVLLQAAAATRSDAPGLMVMPVNPRCPRCLVALRRQHAVRPSGDRTLVALIVDTPVRPGHPVLQAMPPVPVWWDRDGAWRHRWGHRRYGELLEFDAAGGLVSARAAPP